MLKREPFSRPSAATVDKMRVKLGRVLGPSKLLTSEEACARHAGDESDQAAVLPDAVVLAESSEDIQHALTVANDLGVPLTPRAAGTGKAGGAVPVCGGIALCTLGMNDIKEIDRAEQLAVVEPGVRVADLYAAVEAEGLLYPPDPNSHASCAIGGTIATNAAGPRALKYGVTRNYVLGLDVLTASGQRMRTGRRTAKGVTGYDLTALLTGSEGTLAVTLEATLRLIRKPEKIITLLGLFDSVASTGRVVEAIIAAGLVPRCLELLDEACLTAMREQGVAIDPRASSLLIMEVDGTPQSCEKAMEDVGQRAIDAGALDVLVAQDGTQRSRLWEVRRELSHTTRQMARCKISEDVVVPRRHMVELIESVARISEHTGVRMLNYGHAGDGNLHVNLLWDDPDDEPQVTAALDKLFRRVLELDGTLTGEHGIGSSKAEFLPLEQSEAVIDMQRRIKALFDPKGILNPGKIFPRRGHGPC